MITEFSSYNAILEIKSGETFVINNYRQDLVRLSLSYSKRAQVVKNLAAKRLFETMERKKSNLVLAADIIDSDKLLDLIDDVGKHIALLKTHVDIIKDFSNNIVDELEKLAKKRNFMILEDRKFADIGAIVANQYGGGLFRIANWANFVTAHVIPGPGIIDSLYRVAQEKEQEDKKPRGIFILSQMSSAGTLATGDYTKLTVRIANEYKKEVGGLIGTGSSPKDLMKLVSIAGDHPIITPGVHIHEKKGLINQRYGTPEDAIRAGSDAIIVGSGIYKSNDPQEVAEKYREIAWKAYEERKK